MIRVAALLALIASILGGPSLSARSSEARQPAPAGYAVILVLDGAPPGMLDPATMPHLRWLLQRGVSYSRAFVGQLIANTPPSHATIGTGVFPRSHGIMGFWWEDARTRTLTRPTDTNEVEAGALEDVLKSYRAPSLAGAVKATYPNTTTASVSGHKCYAADAMGTPRADYILCSLIYHDRWVAQAVNGHDPPPGAVNNPAFDAPIPDPRSGFAPAIEQWNLGEENDWTIRYALWTFRHAHHPRLLMVNLPETDVTGHFAIQPRAVARTLMAHFDDELGRVISEYRAAGVLRKTVFVVVSDHGMSRLQRRLPFSILDRSIRTAGATKVYLEADTAASIGIREPSKARQVALNISMLGGPLVEASLFKVHSAAGWAYQVAAARPDVSPALRRAYIQLADTSAGPDGPDVLVQYAPGVTTGDRIVRGYHWVGGHLGAGWEEQHIPFIVAGAGVRHGATSSFPARLVDIAPTVERLLGTGYTRTDGVVLSDSLAHSTRVGRAKQRRRASRLAPLVQAIESR